MLPIFAQGLCDGSFETFTAAVCQDLQEKALIVVGDEKAATKLQNSMFSFFEKVFIYPKKDFIFMNMENVNNPFECERLKILGKISDGDFDVVITTLDAMLEYTMPKDKIKEYSMDLKYGESIKNLDSFLKSLVSAGYKRADTVEAVGKFSVRGGIIDIFSPSEEYPVRIELFGDEIDSMGIFDPVSQRRVKNITEFRVIPVTEIVIDEISREKCVSVLEALTKNKNTEQNIKDRLFFELDCLKNGDDISSKDRF
ncbi:MAG: hypothetical protein FWD71_04505, partial [Oscillospiraceae bacterium]|nr:hypothetical protein [Oscillospiraceae bacterium]